MNENMQITRETRVRDVNQWQAEKDGVTVII